MNDITTSDKVIEFLKFVLTEFTQKITTITTSINDVTSQIRTMSTISSQSPTRAEILTKINTVIEVVKEEIDNEIQDHHKDITNFHQLNYEKIIGKMDTREKEQLLMNVDVKEIGTQVKTITTNVDLLEKKIDKLIETVTTLYKILGVIVGVVPILWGLFHFINSITVRK